MIARAEKAHEEEQSRRATQARGRTEPKGHTGRPVSPVRGPTEGQRERQVFLRSASRSSRVNLKAASQG